MILTSTAFEHNGEIPSLYTCDGQDISPPLAWKGLPAKTKSLVLIVYDPDAPDPRAPKMTWVHWILYNIPPHESSIQQAVKSTDLPSDTLEGLNDWNRQGYGGPCPPIGRHRYFHKLYALDKVLPEMRTPTKAEIEKAMTGHIITTGELVGTYERTR